MDDEILRVLREKLQDDISSRERVLCAGGCSTFDGYKELVGVIRGLTLALQHVQDLANAMEETYD